ncbi:MAG: hypothetical protein HBSAPP04_26580 [Ignavibacteriaceae bacterium]|nr:MAG: hypothetical protein EDM75_08250 [Chlorobiota bacterium]GJQ33819.1 MAG: hypothetical protein HBSAPP04_26580 [Ignavibacteriaceae bacterium]
MALANITIFIAQAAALVILIFALISYIVYKVKSRKADLAYTQAPVTAGVQLNHGSHEFVHDHDDHTGFVTAHVPVFARIHTSPNVHQRVTTDDLISMRVAQARDSKPRVVKSSFERPKEKVQMVQNWT